MSIAVGVWNMQDNMLQSRVLDILRKGEKVNWGIVASRMPNRTRRGCCERWAKLRRPRRRVSSLTWSEQVLLPLHCPFVSRGKRGYLCAVPHCRSSHCEHRQPVPQQDFNGDWLVDTMEGALRAVFSIVFSDGSPCSPVVAQLSRRTPGCESW